MFGRIHKGLPTWNKTCKWRLSVGNWYSLVLDVSRLLRPYLFLTSTRTLSPMSSRPSGGSFCRGNEPRTWPQRWHCPSSGAGGRRHGRSDSATTPGDRQQWPRVTSSCYRARAFMYTRLIVSRCFEGSKDEVSDNTIWLTRGTTYVILVCESCVPPYWLLC